MLQREARIAHNRFVVGQILGGLLDQTFLKTASPVLALIAQDLAYKSQAVFVDPSRTTRRSETTVIRLCLSGRYSACPYYLANTDERSQPDHRRRVGRDVCLLAVGSTQLL